MSWYGWACLCVCMRASIDAWMHTWHAAPTYVQASNPGPQNGVCTTDQASGRMPWGTAIQFADDKPTPAASSSAQGCTTHACREPRGQQHARRDMWHGRGILTLTLTVWCSSHWSRSGPSSEPYTGYSRASQVSRNGKASHVQELETPPTPKCHGCVRR